MTISSTTTSVQPLGNGVATAFQFPNKIFAATDLVVTLIDTLGNTYPFTNFANAILGLSYVVNNVDVDQGSSITFSAPPALSWIVDIRSATPDTQSTSIKNQGSFFPELHEEAFDKATRMIQDLLRQTYTFGIHGPDLENTPWPALPNASSRKGLQLIFDPVTGLPTVGAPTSTVVTAAQLAINGVDSGAANAYIWTHTGGIPATLTTGVLIHFTPLNNNTGASTLNADGTGAVAIVGENGQPVTGGELLTIGPVVLRYNGTAWLIVATSGAQPGYNRTASETAQSVIPVDYRFAAGNINRYVVNTTPGTTDISTGLTNSLKANNQVYLPSLYGPYLAAQAASFTWSSNQLIYGDGFGSQLNLSFNTGSNIVGNGITGGRIRDLSLAVTGAGVPGYIGCIALINNSAKNEITRVQITGCSGGGIYVENGNSNSIHRNVLTNFNAPQFTASMTTTVMTVTAMVAGTGALAVGQTIGGVGVAQGTTISSFGTGSGGTGTYNISISQTVGSETMTAGIQDQSDIMIRCIAANGNGSAYNIVEGNQCFGGGWHGIMVLHGASAGAVFNLYNSITNNRIGQHQAYGIAEYQSAVPSDNFNQFIGNYIENVQGSVLGNSAGNGIYIVDAGGAVVMGNSIRNCCIMTANATLAPAGIGINTIVGFSSPVVVKGNVIAQMPKFDGILNVNGSGSVIIEGNSINMPVGNTTGVGINVNGSSFTTVQGNTISSNGTGASILVKGNNITTTQTTITGNTVLQAGAAQCLFMFVVGGTVNFNQVIIKGNNFTVAANSSVMSLTNINNGTVEGNVCTNQNNTATPVTITACTNLTCEGNYIQGGSTVAVSTGGTCTGSSFGKSNLINAATGGRTGQNAFNNGGTGFHVEQLGAAAPAFGTSVLGDIVYNTAGATPWGWMATAGGSPGTWTGLTVP